MKNITNGVVINPEGIELSTGDTIHFGHTVDVVGNRTVSGKPGYTIQPHGLDEGPFVVLASDIRVPDNYNL